MPSWLKRSLALGSHTGKFILLVLIAGRDEETGEKDKNRGENKDKLTTLFPFKAIWQKEHHHRTNRSF